MVEKLGSDQSQLATLGGGVISSDGAPLLSGESDGSQSVMFGPAALRELQSTIANGDWAITPQDAFAEITTDNPLPYWDVSSGGVITVKIVGPGVHSFNTGTGNCLYFTVPPSTPLDATKSVYRMVPIASSQGRAFSYYPEAYGSASDANVTMNITTTYYTQDLTSISGGPTAVYTSSGYYRPSAASINMAPPTNAAFMLVSINVTVNAAGGSGLLTVIKQLTEVRIVRGDEVLMVSEQTTPGTYAPSLIEQKDGVLTITPASSVQINGTLIGDGVTTDLTHGVTLQRTANLTLNTSVDASATAITWSSAVKNTTLYAYWSSGSTIAIPLTGWYSITCHCISGTGLGTGYAWRLYALVNGTVIAESEVQSGANTTSDTFAIATIAYMSAGDSLVFRASASAASKTIGGSRRSACSVVYIGNTSA